MASDKADHDMTCPTGPKEPHQVPGAASSVVRESLAAQCQASRERATSHLNDRTEGQDFQSLTEKDQMAERDQSLTVPVCALVDQGSALIDEDSRFICSSHINRNNPCSELHLNSALQSFQEVLYSRVSQDCHLYRSP